MITVHLIDSGGQRCTISAKPGISLMQAAVGEAVEGIAADCGGMLTCATCHVLVDEPWMQAGSALPPPTSEESDMLQFTASERQPQSRLSCQIVLTAALDGLTVHLPLSQY